MQSRLVRRLIMKRSLWLFLYGEKSAQSSTNCTFKVIQPERQVLGDALQINAGWPPPLLSVAARQCRQPVSPRALFGMRLVAGILSLSLSHSHSLSLSLSHCASVWMSTILVLPQACVLEEFVINESEGRLNRRVKTRECRQVSGDRRFLNGWVNHT